MAFMSAKKSEPAPHRLAAASKAASGVQKSVLGADMEISGDVKSQGEIEVNGKIQGDITCQTLLVGRDAKIKGQVIAESVQVQGTLEGQIRATNVALLGSAHVTGEILHRSLSIEAGAFIEGNAKRIDNEGRPNGKITPLKLSLPHGSGEGEGKRNGTEKASQAN